MLYSKLVVIEIMPSCESLQLLLYIQLTFHPSKQDSLVCWVSLHYGGAGVVLLGWCHCRGCAPQWTPPNMSLQMTTAWDIEVWCHRLLDLTSSIPVVLLHLRRHSSQWRHHLKCSPEPSTSLVVSLQCHPFSVGSKSSCRFLLTNQSLPLWSHHWHPSCINDHHTSCHITVWYQQGASYSKSTAFWYLVEYCILIQYHHKCWQHVDTTPCMLRYCSNKLLRVHIALGQCPTQSGCRIIIIDSFQARKQHETNTIQHSFSPIQIFSCESK